MKIIVLSQELVVVPALDKSPNFTSWAGISMVVKSPTWTTPPLLYSEYSSHSKMEALFQYCFSTSAGSYPSTRTTDQQNRVQSLVVVVVAVVEVNVSVEVLVIEVVAVVVEPVVVVPVLVNVVDVTVSVVVVLVTVVVVLVEVIRCKSSAAVSKKPVTALPIANAKPQGLPPEDG
mmetsp:Transcript_33781/g.96965  ORF Transcript_33781/g.96965 Transcript_33781/m.96965 type:complete len:175 (+) Transcript_33781:649-1173(+)